MGERVHNRRARKRGRIEGQASKRVRRGANVLGIYSIRN